MTSLGKKCDIELQAKYRHKDSDRKPGEVIFLIVNRHERTMKDSQNKKLGYSDSER